MADPKTLAEYNELAMKNSKMHGFGAETGTTIACPFCAAPDFLTLYIVKDGGPTEAMKRGATCKQCGRGMRGEVTQSARGGTVVEMVQTCGDDPPSYLPPIRRVPQ